MNQHKQERSLKMWEGMTIWQSKTKEVISCENAAACFIDTNFWYCSSLKILGRYKLFLWFLKIVWLCS